MRSDARWINGVFLFHLFGGIKSVLLKWKSLCRTRINFLRMAIDLAHTGTQ